MKNKVVGGLVIGLALLIGFIIFMFNRALTNIVSTTCSHGSSCPMWGTIKFQTSVGIGIMVFVILVGIYIMFFTKEKADVIRSKNQYSKEDYVSILNKLSGDEKLVLETIIQSEGTIFQSDLVEKTDLTKVKVTRILDKLEGKHFIERRRRGMTNIVILKKHT